MEQPVKQKLTRDWTEEINGQLTFFGVLKRYYEQVAVQWNKQTQASYMTHYDQFLLPELNEKPLSEITREEFEEVIGRIEEKLTKAKRKSPKAQLDHYRVLIRRVTKTAYEKGVCADILWGTPFVERKPKDDSDATIRTRQRRSLSVAEEVKVFQQIMLDPKQKGERMGLALMFSLGLRNAEACGVDFGDIRPLESHSDCFCALIYKTTEKNSAKRKEGGKTGNAIRAIPIPSALHELIQGRREYIMQEVRSGRISFDGLTKDCTDEELVRILDALPIACVGQQLTEGCTSHHLTMAAKELFQRDVQFDETLIRQIELELRGEENVRNDILEKEATAYLFRRNFGTRMYQLGLTEAEIQYLIGHDIEIKQETRNSYRNEEKLYPIHQKMSRRFLLNPVETEELLINSDYVGRQNVSRLRITIPVEKRNTRKRIIVHSNEADSGLQIRAQAVGVDATAEIRQRPNSAATRKEINITELARARYASYLSKEITSSEKSTQLLEHEMKSPYLEG